VKGSQELGPLRINHSDHPNGGIEWRLSFRAGGETRPGSPEQFGGTSDDSVTMAAPTDRGNPSELTRSG